MADIWGICYFNSHAHVERDFTLAEKSVRFIISTHTLTWSVTPQLKMITTGQWISTHTLTWSVTGICLSSLISFDNFNSHAHVERDLLLSMLFSMFLNFNSHAHVERDGGLFKI